jgi:hypothetical protein
VYVRNGTRYVRVQLKSARGAAALPGPGSLALRCLPNESHVDIAFGSSADKSAEPTRHIGPGMFEAYAMAAVGSAEFDSFPIMTNGRILFHDLAISMLERHAGANPLFDCLHGVTGEARHWSYVQIFEDPANGILRARATREVAVDIENKRDIDFLRKHYMRFPQVAVFFFFF